MNKNQTVRVMPVNTYSLNTIHWNRSWCQIKKGNNSLIADCPSEV